VGKIALVTGGSRGIGRAVAIQLAKDGYDIAFCYRSATADAKEVEAAILEEGRKVMAVSCDVADREAIAKLVNSVEEVLDGELEVVVNNAGITRDKPLVMMETEMWQEVIDTNLGSVFNVCRSAVFGFIKKRSGCIVNVSSVAGVYGNPTQTNYSAAKAGINGFSKALAKEVGPYGIRVNVVAPGFIATDMTAKLDAKRMEKVVSAIPLRRIGESQDVADLVSFLVSDRAQYITGQVFQVDGGIVL
jgi:3-oxoacyl-[acyl-carrier protein] reductase